MGNVTHVGGLFNDTYRVQMHKHPAYELVYYTAGCGHIQIDRTVEDFAPGTITLIAPGVYHTDYADKGFRELFLTVQHPGLAVKDYIRVQDSDNRDALTILTQMRNEYHLKRPNWAALVDGLYTVLCQYLLAFMNDRRRSPYVEQMITAIITNLSNPAYQVGETIERLPFHPNYFRSLFAKEMGMAPAQYLTDRRMAYARDLIRTRHLSGYSFSEIALLCGYNDPDYFSRQFKQCHGVSPRAWSHGNER